MTTETRTSPNAAIYPALDLEIRTEVFPIAGSFRIARGAKTEASVVTVQLRTQSQQGSYLGQGECVPYQRYGESIQTVMEAIESARVNIGRGISTAELAGILPAGAARNAVDCALWDLEAKISGTSAIRRAGLMALPPITTAYTISIDTPEKMAAAAKAAGNRPLLKIKLGADDCLDALRLVAVRAAVPNAQLIADANEGWTQATLTRLMQICAEQHYALIEQPLPASDDECLRTLTHPVPICADESVHDRASLNRLVGLYEVVNIKLDKTGGLTEALSLKAQARTMGFSIMVGCMVSSSLSMAPALIIAADAEFVDLDGPLLLAHDRQHGLTYDGSRIFPPSPELWG